MKDPAIFTGLEARLRPSIAILRAAGRGERMGEITRYFQKCVLPVDGRPLIVHWIDALHRRGIERHVIVNYKGNQVMEAVQDYESQALQSGDGFTTHSMMYLDGIWEDTRHQVKTLRFLQDRAVLLCYADNYARNLKTIIDETLDTGILFRDGDIDAMISVIPTLRCSTQSQRVVLGEQLVSRLHRSPDAKDDIYRVRSYLIDQHEATGWAWSGIAIFQPDIFEAYDYADTVEVLIDLANCGRLAAVRLRDDYYDVQRIWGGRNPGEIFGGNRR